MASAASAAAPQAQELALLACKRSPSKAVQPTFSAVGLAFQGHASGRSTVFVSARHVGAEFPVSRPKEHAPGQLAAEIHSSKGSRPDQEHPSDPPRIRIKPRCRTDPRGVGTAFTSFLSSFFSKAVSRRLPMAAHLSMHVAGRRNKLRSKTETLTQPFLCLWP